MISVALHPEPFNPFAEFQAYQDKLNARGQYGATASFTGTMRDFNQGYQVEEMFLEHYPEMTEKYLLEIAQDATAKWSLLAVLILHRVGEIKIGDSIVFIATWSAHRQAAFESCHMLIESLKSHAPFWKKEQTTQGVRWVDGSLEKQDN